MKDFSGKNKKRPFAPGERFKPRPDGGKSAPYGRPAKPRPEGEPYDRGPSPRPGGFSRYKDQGAGPRAGGFSRPKDAGSAQGGGGFSRYKEHGSGPRSGGFSRKKEGGPRGDAPYSKPAWKDAKPDWKGAKPAWKKSAPGDRNAGGSRYNDRPDAAERTGERPAWKKDRPSYNQGPGAKPRKSYQKPGSAGGQREWARPSDGPKKYGAAPSRPPARYDRAAGPSDRPYERYDRSSDRSFDRKDRPAARPGRPFERNDRPFERNDRSFERNDRPFEWQERPPARPDRSVAYEDRRQVDERPPVPQARTFAPGALLKKDDFPTARTLVLVADDGIATSARPVWIHENMISALPDGQPGAGSTVLVHDHQGRFLGSAIFNPQAPVRARLFSLSRVRFHEDYIREALKNAVERRKRLGLLGESCRLVSGESDGLPGLTADKIGDYVVIHPVTIAVSQHMPFIIDRLNELVAPEGIVVRRDQLARTREGLTTGPPEIHGTAPDRVAVKEGGVTLFANILTGPVSGLALDHRLNRSVIKPYCTADARVLDLYCHVGGWALHAARYGAGEVIGVDLSPSSIELANAGAAASGLSERVGFIEDDALEYLRGMEPGRLFDVIICDPPAFARTRHHKDEATRAYVSLNHLAMKKLKPGGLLVTCSSSQALSSGEFYDAVFTAAQDAQMNFQVLQRRGAAPDHPALLGLPESDVLKCLVLERVE